MIRTLSLITTLLCSLTTALEPRSYVIPAGQINGTAISDVTVGLAAFDGPHITYNNGSAFQWWYFDAVSTASDALIVVQFYPGWTAEASAILFNAAWPNGTTYYQVIPAGALELTTIGDGSQARTTEDGSTMTWFAADDLSAYHLTVNFPNLDISGTITMRSKSPAHVACGPKRDGASFDLTTNFGWANSVPDAVASVNVTVNGSVLAFTGSGYHDQVRSSSSSSSSSSFLAQQSVSLIDLRTNNTKT